MSGRRSNVSARVCDVGGAEVAGLLEARILPDDARRDEIDF